MILLAVDPGTIIAGYAIAHMVGNKVQLLESGACCLPRSAELPERVSLLHSFFENKIVQWNVTDMAIETPFLGKNAANFLKLGYVRGVLYLHVHKYKLGLHEFSPMQIKRAITGCGSADKAQLARVVMRLFPGLVFPAHYDTTDAICLALCGLWNKKSYLSR